MEENIPTEIEEENGKNFESTKENHDRDDFESYMNRVKNFIVKTSPLPKKLRPNFEKLNAKSRQDKQKRLVSIEGLRGMLRNNLKNTLTPKATPKFHKALFFSKKKPKKKIEKDKVDFKKIVEEEEEEELFYRVPSVPQLLTKTIKERSEAMLIQKKRRALTTVKKRRKQSLTATMITSLWKEKSPMRKKKKSILSTKIKGGEKVLRTLKIYKVFKRKKLFMKLLFKKMKNSEIKSVWNLIMLSVLVINLLIIPFRCCFFNFSFAWIFFDLFLDIFYIIDLIANIFPSSKDLLIINEKKMNLLGKKYYFIYIFYYINKRMLIDALCIVPLDIVAYIVGNYYPYFRINRLLKVFAYSQYINKIQRSFKSINLSFVRLMESIIFTVLVVHVVGCLWFLLISIEGIQNASSDFIPSGSDIFHMNVFQQYVRSFYWSLITITGYYNAQPKTNMELIFSIIVSSSGLILYVSIIGSVGSLYNEIDVSSTYFQIKMDAINEFFRFRKINHSIANRIRSYYNFLWKSRRSTNEEETLSTLPVNLRVEILTTLNKAMIEKVPFFMKANGNPNVQFINSIVLKMKPKLAPPNSMIITMGQIGKEMYFISKGAVEVLIGKDQKVVAVLKEGNYFGEVAILLKNTKRTASIRSATYTDLYVINKEDFIDVLENFPNQKKIVKLEAEKRKKAAALMRKNLKKKEEERKKKEKEMEKFIKRNSNEDFFKSKKFRYKNNKKKSTGFLALLKGPRLFRKRGKTVQIADTKNAMDFFAKNVMVDKTSEKGFLFLKRKRLAMTSSNLRNT